MYHEKLVTEASDAINKVFGDTTVDRGTTRGSLEELADQIGTILDAMNEEDRI